MNRRSASRRRAPRMGMRLAGIEGNHHRRFGLPIGARESPRERSVRDNNHQRSGIRPQIRRRVHFGAKCTGRGRTLGEVGKENIEPGIGWRNRCCSCRNPCRFWLRGASAKAEKAQLQQRAQELAAELAGARSEQQKARPSRPRVPGSSRWLPSAKRQSPNWQSSAAACATNSPANPPLKLKPWPRSAGFRPN